MTRTAGSETPTPNSLRPLSALIPFLLPHRRMLACAVLSLLLASGAMLVLPMTLERLVNRGMASPGIEGVNVYFLGFLGAAMAFGVFSALRSYLLTWLGERVAADVRVAAGEPDRAAGRSTGDAG